MGFDLTRRNKINAIKINPIYLLSYILNRKILNFKLRDLCSEFIRIFLPKVKAIYTAEIEDYANNMEKDGITFLPNLLTKNQIIDIENFLADKKMHLSYSRTNKQYDINEIPADAHISAYFEKDLINCPHLLEVANDPLVIDIVSKIFKCKPTISALKIWRSYPGFDVAKDSENFHRDVDDFKFLKLFIYLSDVDEYSGPHTYVKGSYKQNKFLRIERFSDLEIEKEFGKDNILTICGEAGATFLENTFGVHKGLVAEKTGRLVFQVEYSLLPIGVYKYQPIKLERKIDNLDKRINRLFVI